MQNMYMQRNKDRVDVKMQCMQIDKHENEHDGSSKKKMKFRLISHKLIIIRCEGPKRQTREGGSEWEPIKILFKNSAYEPDFTRAPLQASLAKFT
jgi:flagella basal body P-ring formation protein FlgA